MWVEPAYVDAFRRDGFTVIPGALSAEEVARCREALFAIYPSPAQYFADPRAHDQLLEHQFAGLKVFPFAALELNLLVAHPRVVAAVRQLLGIDDLRLAKAEVWAKYGGGDYQQELHRDYGNHTLLVPRRDGAWREATTFIYLSDIDDQCGPTAILPREASDEVAFGLNRHPQKTHPSERLATGPAGSLMVYSYEVFHRGTAMLDPKGSRFTVLADYRADDATWIGKHAFPTHGLNPHMAEFLAAIDHEQRTIMDFPPPGHPFWNDQTIADIKLRYPRMDVTPYARAYRSS